MARFANRLAEKVTIYTHGNETITKNIEEALAQCKPESKTRRNVTIDSRKIVKFVKGAKGGQIEVPFEDGEEDGGIDGTQAKGRIEWSICGAVWT